MLGSSFRKSQLRGLTRIGKVKSALISGNNCDEFISKENAVTELCRKAIFPGLLVRGKKKKILSKSLFLFGKTDMEHFLFQFSLHMVNSVVLQKYLQAFGSGKLLK